MLRPSLKAALKQAASEKCPLIVSRLDRLSRNVHFITGLREHGVHFIVARFGRDLEDFVLHIYASIAQQERKMLADRVNAGLAAAKARGVKLGQAKRSKTEQRRCSQLAAISTSNAAMARAQVYRPHIEAVLQQPGIRSRRITYKGPQTNSTAAKSPHLAAIGGGGLKYVTSAFALDCGVDFPKRGGD